LKNVPVDINLKKLVVQQRLYISYHLYMPMKKKLKNWFSLRGLALLLVLSATQCLERCKQGPAEDTTQLDLHWESDACQANIPSDLDLSKLLVGLIHYVPGEKATYFINVDQTCWKFTQAENRTLNCEKIANIPIALTTYDSFCFHTGSKEAPTLFFGYTESVGYADRVLILYELKSGSWEKKPTANLSTLFPDRRVRQDWGMTSCAIEKDGQYQACILYLFSVIPMFGPIKHNLGCLIYNPTTSSVEKITVDSTYNNSMPSLALLHASIGVAPNKLLLARGEEGGNKHTYDLLEIQQQKLSPLRSNIISPVTVQQANQFIIWGVPNSNRPVWRAFSLSLEASLPVQVPIFTITDKDTTPTFYQMNMQHEFKELTGPSSAASSLQGKKTLVIPFSDYVYVLGSVPDSEGKQNPVAYRGYITTIAPESKKK
jgi:hypothetical protein